MTTRPRRFAAIAATALLTLAACGGGESTEQTAVGEFPDVDSLAGTELKFYNWTDYMPPEMLDRFTEETGIEVTLDTYDSNETLLAKLQAGGTGYDVIVPTDYMIVQMVELGLLQEIDAASFPNGANISDEFLNVYFDEGRKYTAPYQFGTTGIAYDPAAAGTEITSWADFFDPDSPAAGKIGTLNDQTEVVGAALRVVGAEQCSENADDYIKVQELLEAWKPGVVVINSDNVIARMASGEQAVHMMWNGAFFRAKADNPDLEFVIPSEGMPLWQDNLAVPVGAPNVDAAKVFINWMMDPANVAELSNWVGYGTGITGADEFLDAALADEPALNLTGEYAELAKPVAPCSTTALDFYDQVWTAFKE